MARSGKQWCEHCQQYISQKRANEHRAFLFNPYPAPSASEPSLSVPQLNDNDNDRDMAWDEPPLPTSGDLATPSGARHFTGDGLQNIRAWVEDADDEEDLMDTEGWTSRELEDEDEGSEEDDEEDFDWDAFVQRYRAANGNLSAEEQFGASYEHEAAGAMLAEYDLAICRAFAYKLTTHTTDRAFAKTPYAFPRHPSELPLPKLDMIRSRVTALASVEPCLFDCCPNSCCAYTGRHADRDSCPYCNEKRFRTNGKPRKRHVHIDCQSLRHKYFEDSRDIALGLTTDGFAPHKRRKKMAWPLILFNYNLHPDIRFHIENILSLGVIPGPKKPHDIDSFLWPLLEELSRLAHGVCSYDVVNNVIFPLRAYLIAVFGDIPAVSMLMHMKGHNAKSPCRMCSIIGVVGPNDARTHYVPLNRAWIGIDDDNGVRVYDPRNLPMPPDFLLCLPKAQSPEGHLSAGFVTSICAALVTRLNNEHIPGQRRKRIPIGMVRRHLQSAQIEIWGCMRQVDSEEGETIRASSVGGTALEDTRDATFIRYQAYVDVHARMNNRRQKLVLKDFYGQLERIAVVCFTDPAACHALKVTSGEEICLAAIRSCKLDKKQPLIEIGMDMHFYSGFGALDVIGIESVQNLIGRVRDGDRAGWVLLDRSGTLKRTLCIDSDD
ncbi:hypothetical protein D9758_017036 [Tetrapyrgos nigripes]|uniref:Transposase family Tnp2 protein n=1 Tax=Tetrapyrgos nigripes TaxID=182062 RepID=A0A8H5FNC8_9AGAR|nr:hypothetical protein D9758_017036 [Tetrapyrgos nigripes]